MDIGKICGEMTRRQKIAFLSGDGFDRTRETEDLPALTFSAGAGGLFSDAQTGTGNLWETKVATGENLSGSAQDQAGRDSLEGAKIGPGETDAVKMRGDMSRATLFPAPSALGRSWDKYLTGEVAAAVAEEATAAGVHLVRVNLGVRRNPLAGGGSDSFSEDPYLTGELGAFFAGGLQSRGVGACVGPFGLDLQRTKRLTASAECDQRTLREIYLAPFERVMSARPAAVSVAAGRFCGLPCAQNGRLLGILRHEWGYDGVVATDACGAPDPFAAVSAGCDLIFPGREGADESLSALTDERLNESVARLVRLVDETYLEPSGTPDFAAHNRLAYRAALGSMTLLKNDGVLPLKPGSLVALCGEGAFSPRVGGEGANFRPAVRPVSAAEGFARRDYPVSCARGASVSRILRGTVGAECAVVYVGIDESVSDRTDMRLPERDNLLVEALLSAGCRVVAVVEASAPVELPWADRVSAILLAGSAGQMSGQAVADLLIGRVSPCGRLTETWPVSAGDPPCRIGTNGLIECREGIFVGYRYYDAANARVRYPFGHGLGYGTFVYSDLVVKKSGDTDFSVTVTVRNVSGVDAAEVVQLYVTDRSGAFSRPPRELKGFEKVQIKAGGRAVVAMPLDFRSFACFDPMTGRFEIGGGEYLIGVGSSSRDIRLTQPVYLAGTTRSRNALPGWYAAPSGLPPRSDFVALLGRDPVPPSLPQKGDRAADSTLADLSPVCFAARAAARRLRSCLTAERAVRPDKGEAALGEAGREQAEGEVRAALDTPLWALPLLYPGAATPRQVEGIVDAANGRRLRGLLKFFRKARKTPGGGS